MNIHKKIIIIGAAKPWFVEKTFKHTVKFYKTNYIDILTVRMYKDHYSVLNYYHGNIYFINYSNYIFLSIKKIYNLIKTIKPLFNKYDIVVISNIFPYSIIYHLIVMLSYLLLNKKNKESKIILHSTNNIYHGQLFLKHFFLFFYDLFFCFTLDIILFSFLAFIAICIFAIKTIRTLIKFTHAKL